MILFRKKPRRPEPHPDPVIELKLRGIAAIDSLRAAALRQVDAYRKEITDTHAAMRSAPSVYGVRPAIRMEEVFTERIARAEEGIRAQQELILGLGERLEKAIADSGLTDADLACLNLEDR